jgi:hypothetical protein
MFVSYTRELDEFALFLSEFCPKKFNILVIMLPRFSEKMDSVLGYMLTLGKNHWLHLENVEKGLPSLN